MRRYAVYAWNYATARLPAHNGTKTTLPPIACWISCKLFAQADLFTSRGGQDEDVKSWHGILAPLAAPKPIIDKLAAEVTRILAMPDTIESLASLGMMPFSTTPAQFAALLRSDTVRFAELIKAANIKPDT
jgi:hypothetical protein